MWLIDVFDYNEDSALKEERDLHTYYYAILIKKI